MSKENFMRKVQAKVPNRSAFDKSFRNLFTAGVGELVPILCDEVIPNTKVDLDIALNASLAPLASETFMNCDMKLEAFFVPNRILYGGYEAWLTGEKLYKESSSTYVNVEIPRININNTTGSTVIGPGTLADFLGIKFSSAEISNMNNIGTTYSQYFNIFPFLAYHKIYDDWYRNTLVQNPIFHKPVSGSNVSKLNYLPYIFLDSIRQFPLSTGFTDGVMLGQTRQRNFGIDYFTNATPNAQNGSAQSVSIDTSGQSTNMSIASLRAANSLQQMLERNNLCGFKLQDYVKGHFGADLSDGVAQRAMYLGSGTINVYTKGIFQNSPALSGGGSIVPNNPMFATVGAEYGNANANGSVSLIHGFTAAEPGYVFVMASLVPRVTYGSGILRQNLRYNAAGSQVDLADPLLQNTGNQPIYRDELNAYDAIVQPKQVFGYTDKYADFMTREDEVHGLLRDGESLESFALQRNFTNGQASINSSFLEIPKTYLDQVSASQAGISLYGVWVDSYLNYRVSMPLQQYSIPSLQDPAYEHGDSVTLRRGGSRID